MENMQIKEEFKKIVADYIDPNSKMGIRMASDLINLINSEEYLEQYKEDIKDAFEMGRNKGLKKLTKEDVSEIFVETRRTSNSITFE